MEDKFVIYKKSEMHFVEEVDIIYLGAKGSYCNVCLKNGLEYRLSENMKHVFEKIVLKDNFQKIHKSFIVNKNFIRSIIKDENRIGKWAVKLANDLTLPANTDYIRNLKAEKRALQN